VDDHNPTVHSKPGCGALNLGYGGGDLCRFPAIGRNYVFANPWGPAANYYVETRPVSENASRKPYLGSLTAVKDGYKTPSPPPPPPFIRRSAIAPAASAAGNWGPLMRTIAKGMEGPKGHTRSAWGRRKKEPASGGRAMHEARVMRIPNHRSCFGAALGEHETLGPTKKKKNGNQN